MATWIDHTYLIDDKKVPNLTDLSPVGTSLQTQVQRFINKYEPEYLKMVLGETLYNEVIAGLAVLPTPDAKWTALKSKFVDSTNKLSPIANYVFRKLVQKTKIYWIQTGEGENTVQYTREQLSDSWNDMVYQTAEICEWLQDNLTTYPNFALNDGEDLTKFITLDNEFGI
jgi:hypothetical protein